jgi:hypothetical protein
MMMILLGDVRQLWNARTVWMHQRPEAAFARHHTQLASSRVRVGR